MSAQVINFPQSKPRLTAKLLADLTARVMNECKIADPVSDYNTYCVTLDLTPSAIAHYDWAMERLGRTQHRALN